MKTTLTAVLAATLLSLPALADVDPAATVLGPTEVVGDRTQDMWSTRWWQWAASFQGGGPVADRSGAECGAGQDGEVFFLAGTYGSAPVNRTCRVPAGRYLFFPLVNYVVMPGAGSSCENSANTARAITDAPISLHAELEGKPVADLQKHRQATKGCFNLAARSGGSQNAVSNGYWLMLKPLPAGTYKLRFGGQLSSLKQDITYTLIVGEAAR